MESQQLVDLHAATAATVPFAVVVVAAAVVVVVGLLVLAGVEAEASEVAVEAAVEVVQVATIVLQDAATPTQQRLRLHEMAWLTSFARAVDHTEWRG
eukprot:COSAG02_NODE_34532_length_482_cov_1.566580_1_plen_97_part_00